MVKENLPKIRYCFAGMILTGLMIFGGIFSAKASETSIVQVVSPSGGENWEAGKTYNITWASTEYDKVRINVECEGYSSGTILNVSSGVTGGSYNYTVPGNWPVQNQCKAQVSENLSMLISNVSGVNYDVSDNYFSIVNSATSSIQVISPNGGEQFNVNEKMTISWTMSGGIGPAGASEVWLYKGGVKNMLLKDRNITSANAIAWMPETSQTGSDYKIRVISADYPNIYDDSDNYFSIVAATTSITVLSPNGGEKWVQGNSYDITWKATVAGVSKINIGASTGGKDLGMIATGVDTSTGKYAWVIPKDFGLGFVANSNTISVKIRVEDSANPSVVYDDSDNYFSIVAATTFTLPDLSPTVVIYSSAIQKGNIVLFDSGVKNNGPVSTNDFNIKWFVDDVQVGYGAHKGLWANWTLMDDNSRYYWTALEGVHTIKFVVDADNHIEESDETNNTSQVTVTVPGPSITLPGSPITVLSPNGGEKFNVNEKINISWKTNNLNSVPTSNNTIAMPLCAVDLYQSGIDHYIKNLIASYSFSSYSWQIPSDLTVGKYKIGVRCNEVGGATTYADMSDDYFTIKSSAITKCTDYDYGFYKHRFNESDVNQICVDPANFNWKVRDWPEHPSGKRGDETIDGWKKRVGTITSPPVTVAPPVIVPPTPVIPDNDSCAKFYYYEGRFDYAIAKEICANVDGFDWKAKGWPEHPSGKRGDENIEGWKKRAGMAVLSGSGGGGSLKECLPDGTLLKHPDDPKVYVIKDCKKQWIKTAEEFEKNNYDWSAVKESSSVINAYTDYLAAKSNLLKVIGDNQIYRIVEGKKILVPSPSVLNNSGLKLETAATVEKSELNAYPSIKLIKTENDLKVYSVNDLGLKKHIINPDVFNSYPDNKWSDIVTISPTEINAFPETALIKGENDYRVYRIEGNTKRWVKTANAFNKRGFKWSEVAPVNNVELNAYTTGNPIE